MANRIAKSELKGKEGGVLSFAKYPSTTATLRKENKTKVGKFASKARITGDGKSAKEVASRKLAAQRKWEAKKQDETLNPFYDAEAIKNYEELDEETRAFIDEADEAYNK